MAVSLGAKFALVGVTLTVDVQKAVESVGNFFNAVSSYIGGVVKENLPKKLGGNGY